MTLTIPINTEESRVI